MVRWKRSNRTNSSFQIQEIRENIDEALLNSLVSIEQVNEYRRDLNKAYHAEEENWRLKSRNRWLNFGERSSRFYHGVTKAKRSYNNIKGMHDINRILHTKDEAIAHISEDYFMSMFSSSNEMFGNDIISPLSKSYPGDE